MTRGDRGVLSERVLDEVRVVGGEQLVRELLGIFLGRAPARLAAARAAAENGNLTAAEKALHSLRSAAGTVGAERLAGVAARLERAARDGAGDRVTAGLAELEREAEAALAASRHRSEAAAG